VVIAIIAILAAMLLPALAKAKAQAWQAQCENNLKQLQIGWILYSHDNSDFMLPNAPQGNASATDPTANAGSWCSFADEGWPASFDANTNPFYYTTSIMAPYMSGQLGVYRCPADIVPSANGQRIRSYSMNGQIGLVNQSMQSLTLSFNPGFNVYAKVSDAVACPGPTQTFTFCEENMCSLQDGYLQVDCNPIEQFQDVPGSYHTWGCGIAFIDGHVEMHVWQTPILKIPVKYPNRQNDIFAGNQNKDWLWFTQHATCATPTAGP